MRLDNSQVQPLKNITDQFHDNTSFATYSSYIPTNTPYIVAEMSTDIYLQAKRFFVLGDENSTQALNNFPKLYRNGPLQPGSIYTVFVRGFVHSIPPQSAQVCLSCCYSTVSHVIMQESPYRGRISVYVNKAFHSHICNYLGSSSLAMSVKSPKLQDPCLSILKLSL